MNAKIFNRVIFLRITQMMILVLTLWIVGHNLYYYLNPTKVLNYEFLYGLPLIHHAFNLLLVLLVAYLFLVKSKHKGWKITLFTILFIGNSFAGLLRNDYGYSMLENERYSIHIRHYQFLWVRTNFFYCEIDSFSSVYLGYIQEDDHSFTEENVERDHLILREISGEEVVDEVIVDLSAICKQK